MDGTGCTESQAYIVPIKLQLPQPRANLSLCSFAIVMHATSLGMAMTFKVHRVSDATCLRHAHV